MPRFALKIEYNGAPFCGWQRQAGLQTVQGVVEAALRKIDGDCEGVTAAGRTDTGVHAFAQVAHVDLRNYWQVFRLNEALNYHLKPHPVAVLQVARVADDFSARFSATARQYRFRLLARRAPVTHDAGLVWQVPNQLKLAPMQKAAAHLIGRHDFTTFRSVHCQAASPVKTLDTLEITRTDLPHGTEHQFTLKARSFLHNQVRSIVGTLQRVGAGAWQPGDVKAALAAADRAACGPVCPPQGLYLEQVFYTDDPFIS